MLVGIQCRNAANMVAGRCSSLERRCHGAQKGHSSQVQNEGKSANVCGDRQ